MLKQILHKTVQTNPEKIAIVYDTLRISYQTLSNKVANLSTGLSEIGIHQRDCVAIILPNCPEFIISFFATAQLKAIMLPLNPQFEAEEIKTYLKDGKAKAIITDSKRTPLCRRLISEIDETIQLIVVGEDLGEGDYLFEELMTKEGSLPSTEEFYEGASIYLYTSGSTSQYKRVCRTQKNLFYEGHNFVNSAQLTADDNILCTIPLYHSYGLGNGLLAAICAGSTLVILEPYLNQGVPVEMPFAARIPRVLELIQQENIRILPLVPHQFAALADLPPDDTQADFSRIKWCLSSGNFLPEDIFNRFRERYGIPIRSLYGSTETGSIGVNLSPAEQVQYSSLGQPLKNVFIKIVDDNDQELPCNQTGNVLIKSLVLPSPIYDNRQELSSQVVLGDYYRTGDLGKMDEKGYLSLTGRKKVFIDTGGYKVDPGEIEQTLQEHPKIKEVVVLGVKSLHLGEIIKAVIVSHEGEPLQKEDILAFCRDKMAKFKVPRLIEFLPELPRSPLGKILKKELLDNTEENVVEVMTDSQERELQGELVSVEIENLLQNKLQTDLLMMAADILNVNIQKMVHDAHISQYGFDSITFTDFAERLNKQYQLKITPALFFEQSSMNALAQFLCQKYRQQILDHYQESIQVHGRTNTLREETPIETVVEVPHTKGKESLSILGPTNHRPIAIIGISGVMPQSADLESFWQHLESRDDLITEIPVDRWDWKTYYGDPNVETNKTRVKWGGFMPAVDKFDSLFFNISPREAELMDPQQRLFLETVWKTIEDAGYKATELSNSQTAVFVGISTND